MEMSAKRPLMHKHRCSTDPSVYASPMQPEKRNSTLPISQSASLSDIPDMSSLKRFAQAKESIISVFYRIYERLQEVMPFLESVPDISHKSDQVRGLLERTDGIKNVLARDHMKVVFFGRTSNGKSTVINALLHDKILPSGIGHTTNCFCSVVGSSDEEGYLLIPGSNQPQNIKNIQQLANALEEEEKIETSGVVEIHWPMSRCALLKDNVVLVDSPGIDMSPDVDKWIDKHCTDADVFVLVSNAESTLMNIEKSFLHRVSQKLSKPNIFIINNRWDASSQEPDIMEKVRQQHLKKAKVFLTEELGVVDRDVVKDRVFFISAKEVLQLRMKDLKQSSSVPNEIMAEGYQSRLLEFERFETKFNACLSSSAIQTKFGQHYNQAVDIIQELRIILQEVEEECANNCNQLALDLQRSKQRLQELDDSAQQIKEDSCNIVSSINIEVHQKADQLFKDVTCQLSSLVNNFTDIDFDQHNVSVYKERLYSIIDENVIGLLCQRCSLELQKLHNNELQSVADAYQQVLQLPEQKFANLVFQVTKPEMRDIPNCVQLCEGFQEDISFHSSLSSLINVVRHFNIDVVAMAMSGVSNSNYFLRLILIIGLLLALVPFISLTVIGIGMMCCVLFYWWAQLRWSDEAQKRCFDHQLMEYLQSKLKQQISVTAKCYTRIIESDLTKQIDRFSREIELAQIQENNNLNNLLQDQKKLFRLQERVGWLRDALHLLHSDLTDFQRTYLMEQ